MSTALPRPSRPSNGPPTLSLPNLPAAKARKSTAGSATSHNNASPTTPKSGLRAPSSTLLPTSLAPSGGPAQPRSPSGANAAGKSLRKTVSISSFPQPPRGDGRIASLPPSPLTAGVSSRRLKTPTTPTYQLSSAAPSLLNGTGEGKSVSRANGTRDSDGLISVSSPPQSRSSSAQDSYSTLATQYEDVNDVAPQKSDTAAAGKRASKSEKGNVIVSVRVRPNPSGDDRASGEWLVDAKRSLISFRGKEAADYYYGKTLALGEDHEGAPLTRLLQTTCLRRTTTILRCMTIWLSG